MLSLLVIAVDKNSPAATGFVKALPGELRDDLLARGQMRSFAKGQIIQQRGDPAGEFWYIESGSVQIGRYGVDGRLTLFALIGAGDTFGELAFMGEFPRTVDAIAGGDCLLVRSGSRRPCSSFAAISATEPRSGSPNRISPIWSAFRGCRWARR